MANCADYGHSAQMYGLIVVCTDRNINAFVYTFLLLLQFASLGGFILVFGFFAFNGSSQGSISAEGDGAAIALAVVNTVLAASGGAFTTLMLNKIKYFGDKKWSFLTTLNGCLTGMVI